VSSFYAVQRTSSVPRGSEKWVIRQSKLQRWTKSNNTRSSPLHSTDPKADALWKPSAFLPCSCRDTQHRQAEELPAPTASGRGCCARPLILLSRQRTHKHIHDLAWERCCLMPQKKNHSESTELYHQKKGSKLKVSSPLLSQELTSHWRTTSYRKAVF